MYLCMSVCYVHRIPQAVRDLKRPLVQPPVQRRVSCKTSYKTVLLRALSKQVLQTCKGKDYPTGQCAGT